jgi:hypothetical protein
MKKTLLFLMLVFTVSIAAQNREDKKGTQWLNFPASHQQTLKQPASSKQIPAVNESSHFLRKPSVLQQMLQADRKASQSKETVTQPKIGKAKTTSILWVDLGTITSWTETINFDPENTDLISIQRVDEYGYTTNLLCYAVQFTLAQDELVAGMSNNNSNDFTLYADPDAQQEIVWGYSLLQPLKAGTYYLLISECGNLQWSWNAPFQAAIELQAVPATSITFPCQQNANITQDNLLLIANTYYTVFYKFTLNGDAVVNFGCDFDEEAMGEYLSYIEVDLITEQYMINATESDIPLKAGDYYIAVSGIMWDNAAFWAEHSTLVAQLDIQTKTLDAPVALSVPFEQDFSLATNNAYNLFDYNSLLYSLHLDKGQMIEINPGDQWAVVIYNKETWGYINGFYPGQTAIVQLGAGDYYVAIADYYSSYDGETPVNGHLAISIPLSYATLDFSETIAIGETKTGDDASLISIITEVSEYYGIQQEKVAAYHFTAQAGHIYKFEMECYVKASDMQPTLSLFHTPNTGDIYADVIRGAMHSINASSGTGSLTWQSDVDGDINVMFFFEKPASDVMFKLTLQGLATTHTDTQGTIPVYREITLPFVSHLHFDPAYSAYWNESTSEYYKLYRLTLTEKTSLTMASGFNAEQGSNIYFKIFTDGARTQQIGNLDGYGEGGGSIVLDAGTYYVVLSDHEYFRWNGNYAEALVELTGSADFVETLAVAQLMNDAAIPVINYTNNLPYTDQGYFMYGTSKLVTEPNIYLSNVFAKGYKLTGMNVNDEVHIVDRQPAGEYESRLGIYKKEDNGTYTELANNSFDYENPLFFGVTHIKFTATEARDYYIMASSSSSYPALYGNVKYPSYQVAIWTEAAENEPATGNLQLPGEVIFTSTAADATEVNLGVGAGSVDLKLALMALEITATTQAGTTVALKNNPLSWEVNDSGTEASFVLIPIPYLKAETYVPATVQIKKEGMGINNVSPEATIRITNSGNGLVTITGLQGKETISLIDINGHVLHKSNAQGATATVEANALQRGVYILAVQNGKKLTVLKFIR